MDRTERWAGKGHGLGLCSIPRALRWLCPETAMTLLGILLPHLAQWHSRLSIPANQGRPGIYLSVRKTSTPVTLAAKGLGIQSEQKVKVFTRTRSPLQPISWNDRCINGAAPD
jgi:hypothetical protein